MQLKIQNIAVHYFLPHLGNLLKSFEFDTSDARVHFGKSQFTIAGLC